MLVYGTANPEGVGDTQYGGVYLTNGDIQAMVPQMTNVPVKIEHKGGDVGRVVTAWQHDGRMDVVIEIDNHTVEAAIASTFVEGGYCKELSLGYKVEMSRADDGMISVIRKKIIEISLVKQGARDNCQIRGFEERHRLL
jgi:hypothetical protein